MDKGVGHLTFVCVWTRRVSGHAANEKPHGSSGKPVKSAGVTLLEKKSHRDRMWPGMQEV